VAILYIEAWLRGFGAVAIHNLMEDAATAEISRTQLWQWIRHEAPIDAGGRMSRDFYLRIRKEVLEQLLAQPNAGTELSAAAALLDTLVEGEFEDFLTVPGGKLLD